MKVGVVMKIHIDQITIRSQSIKSLIIKFLNGADEKTLELLYLFIKELSE